MSVTSRWIFRELENLDELENLPSASFTTLTKV